MQVVIALLLIAMGMGIDAIYQRKIRIAECDAYETGYQQGLKENSTHKEIGVLDAPKLPSMAAPVEMPPTFEERMKKHGRATIRVK